MSLLARPDSALSITDLLRISQALFKLDAFPDATAALQRAAQREPKHPGVISEQANQYYYHCYSSWLMQTTENAPDWYQADGLAQRPDWATACDWLEQAERVVPRNNVRRYVQAYLLLAEDAWDRQAREPALAALRTALQAIGPKALDASLTEAIVTAVSQARAGASSGQDAAHQALQQRLQALPSALLSVADWLCLNDLLNWNGLLLLGYAARQQAVARALADAEQPAPPPQAVLTAVRAALDQGETAQAGRFLDQLRAAGHEGPQVAELRAVQALLAGDLAAFRAQWPHPPRPVDERFRAYLRGKSVAVVGPAPTGSLDGAEIDGFDVVVRMNWRGPESLPEAEEFGRKTHVALYNAHTVRLLSAEQRLGLVKALDFCLIRRPRYDADRLAWAADRVRMIAEYPGAFYKSLNAVPAVVFDLLLHGVEWVKLFKVNFYLGERQHAERYRGRGDKDLAAIPLRRLQPVMVNHDLTGQLSLVRQVVKQDKSHVEMTDTRVLELTNKAYLDGIAYILRIKNRNFHNSPTARGEVIKSRSKYIDENPLQIFREQCNLSKENHRPLLLVANGPSNKYFENSRVPQNPVIFRLNDFYLEENYQFGDRVDAYHLPIYARRTLAALEIIAQHNFYSIGFYFRPTNLMKPSLPIFVPETSRWTKIARPRLWPRDLFSHFKEFDDFFITRKFGGIPTTGFMQIATGLFLGFEEIYISGLDLFQPLLNEPSSYQHHDYTTPPYIAKTLLKDSLKQGYFKKTHAEDIDIRFLSTLLTLFPNAKIFCAVPESPLSKHLPVAPKKSEKYFSPKSRVKKDIKKFLDLHEKALYAGVNKIGEVHYLDGRLVGWAWDTNKPESNPPKIHVVSEKGEILDQVIPNTFQERLRNAGIGRGNHAFSLDISAYQKHKKIFVGFTDGTELSGSPVTIRQAVLLAHQKDNQIEDELDCKAIEAISASGLFDEEWYLANNPWLLKARIEPIKHYLNTGCHNNASPNQTLNWGKYTQEEQINLSQGENPLLHFIIQGKSSASFKAKPKIKNSSELALTRYAEFIHQIPRGIKKIALIGHDYKLQTGVMRSLSYYVKAITFLKMAEIDTFEVTEFFTKEELIEKFRDYDFVIINSVHPFLKCDAFLDFICSLAPNSFLVYFHETQWAFDKFKTDQTEKYYKFINALPSMNILCVSNAQAEWLKFSFRAKKTYTIYETSALHQENQQDVRQKKKNKMFRVVMAGSVQERKGVQLFLDVARYANEKKLPWRFEWAGFSHTNKLTKLLKDSPYVQYLGALDGEKYFHFISRADVFFLTSKDDPFPLVCIEAIQAYTKVVVYRATGIAEVIQDISGCAVYQDYTLAAAFKSIVDATAKNIDIGQYTALQAKLCLKSFVNRMNFAISKTYGKEFDTYKDSEIEAKAMAASKRKDWESAEFFWRTLQNDAPSRQTDVVLRRCECLREQGKTTEADQLIESALITNSQDHELKFAYARNAVPSHPHSHKRNLYQYTVRLEELLSEKNVVIFAYYQNLTSSFLSANNTEKAKYYHGRAKTLANNKEDRASIEFESINIAFSQLNAKIAPVLNTTTELLDKNIISELRNLYSLFDRSRKYPECNKASMGKMSYIARLTGEETAFIENALKKDINKASKEEATEMVESIRDLIDKLKSIWNTSKTYDSDEKLATIFSCYSADILHTQSWLYINNLLVSHGMFKSAHEIKRLATLRAYSHAESGRYLLTAVKAAIQSGDLVAADHLLSEQELISQDVYKTNFFRLYLNGLMSEKNCSMPSISFDGCLGWLKYTNLVEGKSVAIVGSANNFDADGDEIDSFDVVIRVAYSGERVASQKIYGSKTDVSYFNNAFSNIVADRRDKAFIADLKMVILNSNNHKYTNDLINENKARIMLNPDFLFFNGSANAIQKILYDVLFFNPRRVKIFKSNFYLSANPYASGRAEGATTQIPLKTYPFGHDFMENRQFIRNFWRAGKISGSICGDKECEGVLALTDKEYMDQMSMLLNK
ncbi:alpha-2,3-sialyltransferase [Rhabdochromatium marinum]|uniref:alpha-2,3-sialyltransferase n=1 Tax=Rhabdochromatium marinum TaxID=48729 RepID=UPI001A9109B0|nr:alpha-2,3-sialyltransferase [Rhabdochromatium marinum]